MEVFVVREIGQHRIGAAAGMRELHRAFAETLFQLIEIEVEPRARVTDDHDRFRFDPAAGLRPEIVRVVQGRLITERAAINFPRHDRDEDADDDGDGDAAPRQRRDYPLKTGSR